VFSRPAGRAFALSGYILGYSAAQHSIPVLDKTAFTALRRE
jgi:hypothetical protein